MAAVHRLALMASKHHRDVYDCIALRRPARFELSVTTFADAEGREASIHDLELAF